MSTYTVSRATFRVVRRPTRADLLQAAIDTAIGEPSAWVGSVDLEALAARDATAAIVTAAPSSRLGGEAALAAEARLQAITSSSMMQAMVVRAAGPLLTEATHLLAASGGVSAAADPSEAARLAAEADDLVRRALHATAERVRVDERRVVVEASTRALEDLGYTVDMEEGTRCTGLYATRGDAALVAVVEDGATMQVDWSGCAGDACVSPMAELTERLASEGVECTAVRTVPHGDDRGGQLIRQAAAAAGGGRLAAGAVVQFERGLPARRRAKTDSAAGRSMSSVSPVRGRVGQ